MSTHDQAVPTAPMDHGNTATLQQAGPVLVLALETVLLVPGDHRGLTLIMDLEAMKVLPLLPRLDTMDTVLVLAIMGFNHRDPRVRVCMALADLVVLPAMDLALDPVLATVLVLVIMGFNHRGLPVRVCMGLDMGPGIRDMDRMGGDAEVEACF